MRSRHLPSIKDQKHKVQNHNYATDLQWMNSKKVYKFFLKKGVQFWTCPMVKYLTTEVKWKDST